MTETKIIINQTDQEIRVGLVEQGRLAECFIERTQSIVGNIYKGKIKTILPGMQAAFVDIGLPKAGYLSFDDLVTSSSKSLKENQTIVVQVVREGIGTKGPRITAQISIAGRQLVFMPNSSQVGVSRRIRSDKERRRLRSILDDVTPENTGLLARTAAEGMDKKILQEDVVFLQKCWADIETKKKKGKIPSLIYSDGNLAVRIIRDRMSSDITEIIADTKKNYTEIHKFFTRFMPQWIDRIQLFSGNTPIFEQHGLESALRQAILRKVPLNSGGSLVFDQGEALAVVDVNTGSFVGKKHLEETVITNNLEACQEVVNQMRLRNLGGIVVIDFVDMEEEKNRKKLLDTFCNALKNDRSKTNVTRLSELGLVEMTRKRTQQSLTQTMTETCSTCDGTGSIISQETLCYDLLRQLHQQGQKARKRPVKIEASDAILKRLKQTHQAYLFELEKRFGIPIELCLNNTLADKDYRIRIVSSEKTRSRRTPRNKEKS